MSDNLKAKVEYVKAQGQTRSHHCHWPGCGTQVPPAMWGCKRHWFKLPLAIRTRIWQAYRPGQEKDMRPSREYVAAAREAQDWIRANFPAGVSGPVRERVMTMPHLSNCPHSGDGWCLACVGELHRREREAVGLLRNLLAVIHRDGGHHSAHFGLARSAEAGEEAVTNERVRIDDLTRALSEVEQAGHNLADNFPDLIGHPDRYSLAVGRLASMANAALAEDRRTRGRGDALSATPGAGVFGAVPDEGTV